ncbi:hypothetical protein BO86DRAFT_393438 [Aspergillus japonicus CBS 114.51]|uniref:Uncharacterized protein n=1 Tax=Aspergillus japonicus CBS 114.51 TaxID=1448312 RepID=A0A8T8WKZ3_ASPJA|nr:hypothetical protein BO86DRAFT_393438 [Aspergillus japonicus CBS 114.51]RAH76426.1 hypothetical protein BO86DRAFT_393438 [Aspergillus japonicus CBS 114.51]
MANCLTSTWRSPLLALSATSIGFHLLPNHVDSATSGYQGGHVIDLYLALSHTTPHPHTPLPPTGIILLEDSTVPPPPRGVIRRRFQATEL